MKLKQINAYDPRVVRGGSWLNPSQVLRASVRSGNDPRYRLVFLGFRVVTQQTIVVHPELLE